MARARRKKGNVELAAELRTWAATHQISDDIYLSELADALESGDQLDYWSRYENLDLLPTPVGTSGQRELRLSDALINFRNIMVFVPVAFTWAGISQATAAFSEYAASNTNKVVNFFDFWENGYGVLNQFWTLSNIALIDFLLLMIVIIASTLITVFQVKARRLISVVNQRVAQSVTNLKKSSEGLVRASKALDKGAANLSKGSPVLTQLSALKKLMEKKQK
jgi:hypothetical protein